MYGFSPTSNHPSHHTNIPRSSHEAAFMNNNNNSHNVNNNNNNNNSSHHYRDLSLDKDSSLGEW